MADAQYVMTPDSRSITNSTLEDGFVPSAALPPNVVSIYVVCGGKR